MSDEKILAVIKPGDEEHYLVRRFTESLPKDTEKLYESFGCIGTLENKVSYRPEKQISKHFAIYDLDNLNDLDLSYFSSTPSANVLKINRIEPKIVYAREDRGVLHWVKRQVDNVEEGLNIYNDLLVEDWGEMFVRHLNDSAIFRKDFLRSTWFGLRENNITPTYISIGLGDVEGRFLFASTKERLYSGAYLEGKKV